MCKHILVVEDETYIRELYIDLLNENNYKVTTANNGKEALNFYKDNYQDIDLIISDMKMPVMDGYEFFTNARKINPEAKVIIVTGYSTIGASQMIKEGAVGYLNKPEAFNKILSVLDEHLN